MNTLLIVEDDKIIRERLTAALGTRTLRADSAADLASAREYLKSKTPDLLLLDCNLPDGNGFELCREHRELPVLILRVRDQEAEDFIKNQLSVLILRERINAVLSGARSDLYTDSRFEFDLAKRRFFLDGKELRLSSSEERLLLALASRPGEVVSREGLIFRVWECPVEYVDKNALSFLMKGLRSKLPPGCIRTIYGGGYMWVGDAGDQRIL